MASARCAGILTSYPKRERPAANSVGQANKRVAHFLLRLATLSYCGRDGTLSTAVTLDCWAGRRSPHQTSDGQETGVGYESCRMGSGSLRHCVDERFTGSIEAAGLGASMGARSCPHLHFLFLGLLHLEQIGGSLSRDPYSVLEGNGERNTVLFANA
jgi:hypothetical protein